MSTTVPVNKAIKRVNIIEAVGDAAANVPDHPRVSAPHTKAAGVEGAVRGAFFGVRERGLLPLIVLNSPKGVKCPGCAWPDAQPGEGGIVDFCENGAKALAEETTGRRCTPQFFADYSIVDLRAETDYWLSRQGRLTTPMIIREGSDHYEPIGWDEAYDLIADEIKKHHPDETVYYTSGRASNESAFMLQVLAKRVGTNNLPDCSNMCHEATGKACGPTIGIGKGTVTLDDLEQTGLIITLGQNPGTNHPRQLISFAKAKKNGAKMIAINPLKEAGLQNFLNPQKPVGALGIGEKLADEYLQIRLDGDLAFWQGVNHVLVERGYIDWDFLRKYCANYEETIAYLRSVDPDEVVRQCGLPWEDVEMVAQSIIEAGERGVVTCWALGATQHMNSVPLLREIVNMHLLTGNIGRPGAGTCPVRGHSNVQGDRTVGVWEEPSEALLDGVEKEFGFKVPRHHGYNVTRTCQAMRDGKVRFFLSLGGNFLRAAGDTAVLEEVIDQVDMTVMLSTKLNRSHLYPGKTGLILPVLTRSDLNLDPEGNPQAVSTEDSMGYVTASYGKHKILQDLPSEMKIFGEIGYRLHHEQYWRDMGNYTTEIRKRIEGVFPIFENYEERMKEPAGLILYNGPRVREFTTPNGKANLSVNTMRTTQAREGYFLMQTLRSHDQYNTTIYGMSDRYRGIHSGRRVVLMNPADMQQCGYEQGDLVDIYADYEDGTRRAPNFRIVEYDTPRGCLATYMPETNVLISMDSFGESSETPIMKSIEVRLEPALLAQATADPSAVAAGAAGSSDGASGSGRTRGAGGTPAGRGEVTTAV
ncbi:FdhF/YdeP family oxidoreductase [Gleimia hominis]|uniref:FdhF/YdeP family oxidoreductase n=1 Tax=Gleimia hominis TaxID=595468 RepID=UPI000C804284|nr:FdhF/YdeP family oxidoreductase [Gleimia hominis]WIK64490.1 FdhF/YdeP family oxidoreductase [Gleimia hominis]